MADTNRKFPSFVSSLLSGAMAGMAVDVSLFPLDTVKTRLQSSQGFWKAGGLRNIYSGIGSVVIGSSPGSAVFFCTYEMVRKFCIQHDAKFQTSVNMLAASCGEVVSCIIRVPTEVIKQKTQANATCSSWKVFNGVIQAEGIKGLYRGYFSTIFREIPFSLIQFPIWEYLKHIWSDKQGFYVKPWQSSFCGALAGSLAAAVTTPLDVAKTRIMLAEHGSDTAKGNIIPVMQDVFRSKGISGLFSGIVPRVLWISIGGAVFFGVYEKSKQLLSLMLFT